jgi:zinc transport system substrate-binding protein
MPIYEILFSRTTARTALAAIFLMVPSISGLASPNVVVTIKPIHSLVATVLEGVALPTLLLDGAASPHTYALKPSDADALSNADVVIRVSENLEVFLAKALKSLPSNARLIDLERTPGLRLLPVRRSGVFDHEGENEEEHGHTHGADGRDVHFWLDPVNAIAIAENLGGQFAALDPDHADRYSANVVKLKTKLAVLDRELRNKLSPYSGKPFIVFHDVTQYLERRYGLHSLGAITLSPELEPGAKRLTAIRAKIAEAKILCAFSEPQFPPKLVGVLTEGTQVRHGVIDEIGATIPPGPEQYFALLRADAKALASCLE